MAVVTITYSPAVAVYISGSGDIDQSDAKVIITVTGHVILVEASVEVNGTPVKVSQGGNFSTPVQIYDGNNIVCASASFEGEEDSYSFVRIVEDGKVIIPPGQGLMYQSRFSYEESVEMEAGEEMHLGIVGDIRKGIPDPIILSCELDAVDGEYSEKEISPEGMEV